MIDGIIMFDDWRPLLIVTCIAIIVVYFLLFLFGRRNPEIVRLEHELNIRWLE